MFDGFKKMRKAARRRKTTATSKAQEDDSSEKLEGEEGGGRKDNDTKQKQYQKHRPFRFSYALADESPLFNSSESIAYARTKQIHFLKLEEESKDITRINNWQEGSEGYGVLPSLLSICIASIVNNKLYPIGTSLSSISATSDVFEGKLIIV